MTDPIRTEALVKRYGRVLALQNVSLTVASGSIVGLIGPNGAGKSTLIRTLLNITKPDSGRAEVLGRDSRKLTPSDLTQIGYVSEGQDMPEWMSVDYLLRYLAPFYPQWDDAAAEQMRSALQLPREQTIRGLSRGMRMKLALLCALAYDPPLVILDEPFSGLDPLVRDEFTSQLLDRAGDRTVLISSHDLAEMETFVTHLVYLEGGRVLFHEEADSLMRRFRQVDVVLGDQPAMPEKWPEDWLQVENSRSVVRFVHPRFDESESPERIRAVLPGTESINVAPLGLRAIFLALARSSRSMQKVTQ